VKEFAQANTDLGSLCLMGTSVFPSIGSGRWPRRRSLCVAATWCGAQADTRGATQVLDLGAQAVARSTARCGPQVLDRGAEAVARGAATLSQQENNNTADAQRAQGK